MGRCRTFLVERYVPQLEEADISALAERLVAVTAELQADGHQIRWLGSFAVPVDEICLCIFTADARAEVEEANRRAGATYERILDTVAFENSSTDR